MPQPRTPSQKAAGWTWLVIAVVLATFLLAVVLGAFLIHRPHGFGIADAVSHIVFLPLLWWCTSSAAQRGVCVLGWHDAPRRQRP